MSVSLRVRSWVGGLVAVALSLALPAASQAAPSERVYYDDSGRLRSVADASGNRIPDCSHAGYRGGGTVHVNADGIVLRGAGRGSDTATNTLIVRTGSNDGPVIVLGGGTNNRWRDEIADTRSDVISDPFTTTWTVPWRSRTCTSSIAPAS